MPIMLKKKKQIKKKKREGVKQAYFVSGDHKLKGLEFFFEHH